MRAALFLFSFAIVGCGPSPAMQPAQPTQVTPANVVVCAIDDDDDVVGLEEAPPPSSKPIEYVRMDEWQPPPSVQAIEARIEPRGNKPPDYVRLPALTMHREIAPMTTWRHGSYWH